MDDSLREQLEKLERAVRELDQAAKVALGFTHTVEYEGITFYVHPRFVVPDVAPLSYLELVEYTTEGVDSAVVRLYERISPLLTCEHSWTHLKRAEDERLRGFGESLAVTEGAVYVCQICTAYALGTPLPLIGRMFAES
jgi:hypothetical protein